MGVVDALLSCFRPLRRTFPVFGRMRYMGGRVEYWEGKVEFPPTASTIEVFVDGSAVDGMETQREFFSRVLQEWPSLSQAIGRALSEGWQRHEPRAPVKLPWEHFMPSSLNIPKASFETAEWEISFVTTLDPGHLWSVHMRGDQPQAIVLDG